jgi:hypothetical protein
MQALLRCPPSAEAFVFLNSAYLRLEAVQVRRSSGDVVVKALALVEANRAAAGRWAARPTTRIWHKIMSWR